MVRSIGILILNSNGTIVKFDINLDTSNTQVKDLFILVLLCYSPIIKKETHI